MYKALSPGAIRIRVNTISEAIAAAELGGFGGVEFSPHEIADLIDSQSAEAVIALFAEASIKPAGCGLPVEWRGSEVAWRSGLEALPRLARAIAAIGSTRVSTWVMPCSDTREFAENYEFHVQRFLPIAAILGDYGLSLGLEFIGPKTLCETQKFPFIFAMDEMLQMGRDIGTNVGLLLDSFHWYTSGGTLEDLLALTSDRVVVVHVNDAPRGVPRDEQVDNIRALPGATGVIDIVGFLHALESIGFDGPVIPEPFVDLSGLPSDAARLKTVGTAMDDIWAKAGVR